MEAPDGQFVLAFARRNVSVDLVLHAATNHGFVWTQPCSSDAEGVFVFARGEVKNSISQRIDLKSFLVC